MQINSYKNYQDKWILLCLGMILAFILMLIPLFWWGNGWKENEIDYVWCTRTADVEAEFIRNWTETAESACELLASENCPSINCDLMKDIEQEKEWHPWDLNEAKDAQEMPVLTETESHQRFIELCEKYNLPADVIWHTENYYWLKEGTVLCIAITETSGWTKWYGREWCWNYGNVGNNDWGNRKCFANQWAWLAAIGQTLNNNNLRNNKTIACLHWAWNCIEPDASGYRYATSQSWNWWRNMVWCFYAIYGQKINQSTFNLHERN